MPSSAPLLNQQMIVLGMCYRCSSRCLLRIPTFDLDLPCSENSEVVIILYFKTTSIDESFKLVVASDPCVCYVMAHAMQFLNS